jgi:hypothetical protein
MPVPASCIYFFLSGEGEVNPAKVNWSAIRKILLDTVR